MGRPKSYVEQGGCHDCDHVFERFDQGEEREWFCTFGAPRRPMCMAMSMSDEWPSNSDYDEVLEAWKKWSFGREVKPWGKCKKGEAQDGTE